MNRYRLPEIFNTDQGPKFTEMNSHERSGRPEYPSQWMPWLLDGEHEDRTSLAFFEI